MVDEWTLCEALGSNMTQVITEHYETFIVSSVSFLILDSGRRQWRWRAGRARRREGGREARGSEAGEWGG